MIRFFIVILLTCVSSALGQTTHVPSNLDPTEAITRLREGLIDSFTKGDVDRLLTYLDTNVVVTWQNGEVCSGPAEVRAYHDKMMKGDHPIVRQVQAQPEVLGRHIYGDWAVSWGNLHDHFILVDGTELPFNTIFTATIARRGDRWLVTAFHASVNAFNNPVLSLATHKIGLMAGIVGAIVGTLIGLIIGRVVGRKRTSAT